MIIVYMYLLSLILVIAKLFAGYDLTWFQCFVPVIIVLVMHIFVAIPEVNKEEEEK